MKITPEMLRDAGACVDHLDIFTTEWPDGAEVTLANCLRAAELGLNLGWAARVLLPYAHWSEYLRRCAPFWEEYDRQRAPFRAEYDRQRAPFRAEYVRQRAPFLDEYLRQRASVFFAIASKL